MIAIHRHTRPAFTLIEALAACMILAASLVALIGLNTRAVRSLVWVGQYDAAWQVLDRQLTLIDRMGIDAFMEQGVTAGQTEQDGAVYHWSVATQTESIDALVTVEVTVSWQTMNRRHSVAAQTRFNGQSTVTASVSTL